MQDDLVESGQCAPQSSAALQSLHEPICDEWLRELLGTCLPHSAQSGRHIGVVCQVVKMA